MKGYLGKFSQGTRVYFLRGYKNARGPYNVTFITEGKNNIGSNNDPFSLTIENSRLRFNGKLPFRFKNKIMQTNDLPEVEYSSTCLYTGPTKASIPIHNGAELKLLSNRTCRIIQIGPIESANEGN